jgi:DNA-binding SARP family transcriptional activator/tetratricopeptide (TPR) repeat protein
VTQEGIPQLEIRVLGELELLRGGERIALPASKKTRALLGYLVVVVQAHARQRLCDLFWDGPDDPRAELRWSLTKLRPLVDDANDRRLSADRERVSFEPKGAAIDLAMVRLDTAHLDKAPVDTLRQAAARFRGELLEGLDLPGCFRYHEWCVAEREAARRLRVDVLTLLTERLAGEPEEALAHARVRVAIDPLAEAGHVAVMRLLDRIGRPREALKQYESCKRILEAQLGRKPSSELEAARMALGNSATKNTVPAPPHPAPSSRSFHTVVGRRAECSTIAGLASEAEAGVCSRMLLFVGEPGIGKTRLLREAADQIIARGGGVLMGRAFEAEMVRAYGPWIDALRSASLGPIDESVRAGLAPLLPELGSAQADIDRTRLFDAVMRLLTVRATSAPLLVALDDLQWFDEASVALLHYVVRSLPPSHVLLACAARAGEIDANARVQGLVRGLGRDGRLARVDLGPLDAEATTELVRAVGVGLDAAQVFADGGGNPLFSIELARAGDRSDGEVPYTLERLIADRLSRLDDRAAELVPWTAALGRGFSIDTLAALTSWPASDLLRAVEDLERNGVVSNASSALGSVGYDYSHDLVRRTAYRAMSEPRRRWVHLHIARALAGTKDQEGTLSGEIAHHATLGGDSELAARAYVTAGERCLRMYAYVEASQMAARGRQHVERLPRELGIELGVALLSVYLHSNQWMRRPRDQQRELEDELARLTVEAERCAMHAHVARGFYLLSYLHHERGEMTRAGETSWRAVKASRAADPKTHQLQLANTGRCLALIETDVPQAEALLREAQARAGEGGANVWMEITAGLGFVHAFRGEDDAATTLLERAAELALSVGAGWAQYHAIARLALIGLERGRPHEALLRCDALDPIVAKLGEGGEAPFAATIRALARLSSGVESARGDVDRAIEILRAVDSQAHLAYALNTVAEWDERAGRPADARRAADEALAAAQKVGRRSEAAVARALLARLALARGDRDEALGQMRACAPDLAKPVVLSARACSALARAAEQAGVAVSALIA